MPFNHKTGITMLNKTQKFTLIVALCLAAICTAQAETNFLLNPQDNNNNRQTYLKDLVPSSTILEVCTPRKNEQNEQLKKTDEFKNLMQVLNNVSQQKKRKTKTNSRKAKQRNKRGISFLISPDGKMTKTITMFN
jgi:hypothetical protein